jgi:N-acetylmuramoyl-L-alanine amidase
MPAALVETAFLSNPDDRVLLQSSQWRQKMAQAIADGISDYAGPPPAAGSVSGQ